MTDDPLEPYNRVFAPKGTNGHARPRSIVSDADAIIAAHEAALRQERDRRLARRFRLEFLVRVLLVIVVGAGLSWIAYAVDSGLDGVARAISNK